MDSLERICVAIVGQENDSEGILAMSYWMMLATRWRADGTHRPDRNFLSAVENGDSLALAFLGVALISVVGSALYRFIHKR